MYLKSGAVQYKKIDERLLMSWISVYKNKLAGSAIFVRNESLLSKIISSVCKNKCPDKTFIPSHVGSLVLVGGDVAVFDMVPPKAKITPLIDYLTSTDDDYEIVMRDFDLDVEKFSFGIVERVNKRYGYLSAIQSAFKWLWYPLREHCSEIHLRELQKQRLFEGIDANEITPDGLYHLLIERGLK